MARRIFSCTSSTCLKIENIFNINIAMNSIDYITLKMLSMNSSKSMNKLNPIQSSNRDKIIAEKMEIETKRREIIMSERFERHLMAYRQRKM